ncbi:MULTISPECIES: response regulator transcription factor [Aerococcus]|uniref:Response regulator transcription factor n=1 Tax=Aerococcus sanguinicola TaxID=119206 RepID=A0A5N1GQB9_9LACT|nr:MULTISPECIES: response regulator transcription factor [Aerococcus]KAA9302251.1 response regulator transcription factor [Aerococcus sanguinicola]MDK6369004.1 response regulator transcription factor [Aerococcus sp. UMB9870]MDK6678906.1 response regulator transcription factor [Aerococcus sp. UMB8608]MDK6686775.1 response regulator transcription factor [Aerococcus sp. UMB8623]MDK6939565.1 response regulator transcription factor [Aerococcus sp. UMB8487]
MHILMIDDDASICEMMGMYFDREDGWTADFIADGQEGWEYFLDHEDEIEMIILDLNLPSLNGREICKKIRARNKMVPIIMLTARDSESDQVLGLELGADDYVTKPFSLLTMVARMKALYRRYQEEQDQLSKLDQGEGVADDQASGHIIKTRSIRINTKTREAYYGDQEIKDLTPKEFDILALLAAHPKQVFTRENLLSSLWEEPFYGDERTVDAHIKKLRHKMEALGPQVIQTVWGVGYKFDETEEG